MAGQGRLAASDAPTVAVPVVPSAPLCKALSDQALCDGLQIVLKGRQMGGAHFYPQVREAPQELSDRGIVEISHGKRARVGVPSPGPRIHHKPNSVAQLTSKPASPAQACSVGI